ncbi:MAG TPA: metalloregulator ArsR/SmtB family transcription factor [Gammaproteobacteria bacterium]|nr:metalloregulator ArsR/SmtB family transcription factor [Gammaproteobacteria bacterium]
MKGTPSLTAIGRILGDPTRTLILEMLYDGRDWSASELANAAGITPQTASSHLGKLIDANLLAVEPQGRNRYYRLADSEVAEALEALMVLAMRRNRRPDLVSVREDPLRHARTCYDHIAGCLGIAIVDRLIAQESLVNDHQHYRLTEKGADLMTSLGIDLQSIRGGRRPFTRRCLDWTERRHHLGGALGAALAACFFDRRWIRRIDQTRALKITPEGQRQLKRLGLYA